MIRMRRVEGLVLGALLCMPCSLMAGGTTITLRVHAPHMLYPLTKIYVSGSFNTWKYFDSTYALKEISRGNYTIQLTLPADSSFEYKYTLWSPLEMEKAADGSDRPNRRLRVREGLVQQDTVPRWTVEAVNRGYWKYEEVAPHQVEFLYKHFRTRMQQAHTHAEIDSLIKAVQIAWHEEAQKHYRGSQVLRMGTSPDLPYHPGKQNIGGGGFSPQVYVYFIIDPDRSQVDQDRRQYIVANYALPAFLDEQPFLWKNPNPMKAFRIVEAQNIITAAGLYRFADAQWRELYKSFETMPQLIDLYLSRKLYARPDVRAALEGFQANLIALRPLWRVMDAMQRGRRDLALALFKTDLLTAGGEFTGENSWQRAAVALRLYAECMEAHEKKQAMELLDFLAARTTDGFLHRDSLKVRYAAADPEGGLQRFQNVMRSRPTFRLGANDSTVQLYGTYVDAVTGAAVRLESLRGKLVLIDVWTTWCTPCRLEMPELNAFAARLKSRKDVVLLSVNGDRYTGGKSRTEIVRFVKEQALGFPVLLDTPESSLIQRWGVNHFPAKLLFDERGRVLRGAKDHLTLREAEAFFQNNRPRQGGE